MTGHTQFTHALVAHGQFRFVWICPSCGREKMDTADCSHPGGPEQDDETDRMVRPLTVTCDDCRCQFAIDDLHHHA